MNGLTLLALIALAIGAFVAYRVGVMHGRRDARPVTPPFAPSGANPPARVPATAESRGAEPAPAGVRAVPPAAGTAEMPRTGVPHPASADDAELAQLRVLAEDRRALFATLAEARAEIARYRQIVVDIENNAPPPLLASPGAPDDLKLIVGVGPVLERMLQQLGISTYRQIARWTDRDIDAFDARLPEFHGRVRRDDWVTQARELHLSKYGERP